MRQTLCGSYSAARLFVLWLVERFGKRMRELSRQLGEIPFAVVARGGRLGAGESLSRLVKLGATQLLAYAAAVGSLAARSGRTRSRFWSFKDGVPEARIDGTYPPTSSR